MLDEHKKSAIDGLADAPVFRPSEEEFSSPFAYIASIREQAEPFGICKVYTTLYRAPLPSLSSLSPSPSTSEVNSKFTSRPSLSHLLNLSCSPLPHALPTYNLFMYTYNRLSPPRAGNRLSPSTARIFGSTSSSNPSTPSPSSPPPPPSHSIHNRNPSLIRQQQKGGRQGMWGPAG